MPVPVQVSTTSCTKGDLFCHRSHMSHMYNYWVVPLPSDSHHQDDMEHFSALNLHLPRLHTGKGDNSMYPNENIYNNCNFLNCSIYHAIPQHFCRQTTSVGRILYISGTQMTLVLIGNGLLLEGSTPKGQNNFQVYNYTRNYIL